jgi:energy-coupling factor transport system permease protein
MLGDITLGQFFPGDSPVHRVDPRMKLLLTVVYISLTFLIKDFLGYGLLLALLLFCTLLSGLKLKFMLLSLKPILMIILFTFFLNMFFAKGDQVLFRWHVVVITEESLYFAAFMALRLVFLILGTSLLTLTTSPIALTDGLERVLKPLKLVRFPVHELSMMMTIALRFIPTLLEETDKIMKAQAARGADFDTGNLLQRAKAMVPLLVPLFISAFRRADELAIAMEARCYHGGEGRTRMKILKLQPVDYLALLLFLALLAVEILRQGAF